MLPKNIINKNGTKIYMFLKQRLRMPSKLRKVWKSKSLNDLFPCSGIQCHLTYQKYLDLKSPIQLLYEKRVNIQNYI